MSEAFKPNFNKNETEHNVYGREKFLPEIAKEHVESLVTDFKEHYASLGYQEEPPVQISSGVDPTVRFIGSHISVFKPYLAEGIAPNPGLFMRQDCLRTRNADKLLDDPTSRINCNTRVISKTYECKQKIRYRRSFTAYVA